MTAYPGQTTMGQMCAALWDSQSRPVVIQPGIATRSVVTPLALRSSALDRSATLGAQHQTCCMIEYILLGLSLTPNRWRCSGDLNVGYTYFILFVVKLCSKSFSLIAFDSEKTSLYEMYVFILQSVISLWQKTAHNSTTEFTLIRRKHPSHLGQHE